MTLPTLEELLEQGTHYDLSARLSLVHGPKSPGWLLYWEGVELHFKANVANDPKYFATAREALTYLHTASAMKVLRAVGAEPPRTGGK